VLDKQIAASAAPTQDSRRYNRLVRDRRRSKGEATPAISKAAIVAELER